MGTYKEVIIAGMKEDKETGEWNTSPDIEGVEHWDVLVVRRDESGDLLDEVESVEKLAGMGDAEIAANELSKKHGGATITSIY